MEDIEKLCEDLRKASYKYGSCIYGWHYFDEAANAIEKLQALAQNGQSAIDTNQRLVDKIRELQAENERIRSNCYARDGVEAIIRERDRFKAERDAAVKCIEDIYTYLCLGSEKYIARTIQRWMGAKEANHG